MRGAAFPPSPQSLNYPPCFWVSNGPLALPSLGVLLTPLSSPEAPNGLQNANHSQRLTFPKLSALTVWCDSPSTPTWEVGGMLGVTPILQGRK